MKAVIYGLIFVALLLTALPLIAQEEIELPETYVFVSGASFNYPAEWRLDEESAYVLVSKQPDFVLFVDFEPFEIQGIEPDSDLADELRRAFQTLYGNGANFDAKKVESIEIDDREAVRYPYVDDQGRNAILIFLRFSDGTFGMTLASANMGEVDEALALAIISTFDSLGDMATEESVTTGECRVSTRARDTVQMHVGPGVNRAVFDFMPAGEDFQVLDQAEAVDGSLWWKLDRAEVAPRAAASEAWVAQDAVTSMGDCDAIGDEDAATAVPVTPTPSS